MTHTLYHLHFDSWDATLEQSGVKSSESNIDPRESFDSTESDSESPPLAMLLIGVVVSLLLFFI